MTTQMSIESSSIIHRAYDLSKPCTWEVPVKEAKSCDFDAIVVGSGIGGLACAALLAKHKFKVLVLEQHYMVGGFCSSFKRQGFTFTSGVEDISGVDEGTMGRLLQALALKKEDLFKLNTRLFLIGGKEIRLDGTKEGTIIGLSQAFPEASDAIRGFLNEADSVLHKKNLELVKQWESKTFQQKLDEFFTLDELKAFFSSLLGYIGVPADKISATGALGPCLSYFIVGGYYPKGGPQHLADTLSSYILAHGGCVKTKAPVDEVIVADDEVRGVRVGTKTFSSSVVVGNVNAKTLFGKLVTPHKVNKAYVEALSSLGMSMSLCMVQIGTDLDLSHLPSHLQILDPEARLHCVINSNADSSMAPPNMSCITFLCRGDFRKTPQRGTDEYDQYKEQKLEMVLSSAERIIPNLRDHKIAHDVSTPRTFERYTSMPEGAIYAFDQSKGTPRPYFKTPIRGLYLSSASTTQGAGIESVVRAAFRCAEDIVGHGV